METEGVADCKSVLVNVATTGITWDMLTLEFSIRLDVVTFGDAGTVLDIVPVTERN